MRPIGSALSIALLFAFLTACGAANLSPASAPIQPDSVIPQSLQSFEMRAAPPHRFVYLAKPKAGVYAAQFYGTTILGYRNGNKSDAKPACKIGATYVNGFGVDSTGNLVVPNGYPYVVGVYSGPTLCGKALGSFSDPYGEPSDAASRDAKTGTIVVGNIEVGRSQQVGNIAVCTLAAGCTRELKSPTIKYEGGGVALAANGDCWMSSEDNPSLTSATLTYFKGCKSPGQAAKGWKNAFYGGLNIDKAGNLIAVDFNAPSVWVYKGCNPQCTVVGGPFPLEGVSFYGNLNAKGDQLALGDSSYGQVDVYAYSPAKITYEYSFNKGLVQGNDVEAAGFAPGL
ncbi:MAG: hypothetical protein JOZ77_09115 [Candidatus Eremiobacteraeota bacterium]|nr:hypothetical protein [Candidatus Eremiobacteraeota bacterium]